MVIIMHRLEPIMLLKIAYYALSSAQKSSLLCSQNQDYAQEPTVLLE